jgi:glycerol-3-phosphate acyltransferase PlsX
LRIAIDAMGGDHAPLATVQGAVLAARDHIPVTLVGVRSEIERALQACDVSPSPDIRILDAEDVVAMNDSPSTVLRRKRRASVCVAAEAVARGEADAMFSAGHTGATVLAAHAAFGMLRGAERPALATTIPTTTGTAVLLDAGANVECRPVHLVHFAIMGSVFARTALGVESPRVGLLSIGEEETKGNDLTRDAHRLLKTTPLRFIGNLEARDVFTGQADVIVCDGFTGNIALKVGEGLVGAVEHLLRDEMSRTWRARLGFLLSRTAFRHLRKRLDYSEYGGAPLLGVAGLCLVGHGRSSAKAIRNAIVLASTYASQGMLRRLESEPGALNEGSG